MRYLGIDYGDNNIGISLSDDSGFMAFPYKVFRNRSKAQVIKLILNLVKREEIKAVIVGIPIFKQNRVYEKQVKEFVNTLKKELPVSIYLENELMSTKLAYEYKGKLRPTGDIDATAAAVILQSFLDKRKRMQGD